MKVNRKPYYHRSSIENTLAQMPRYNAYACGMENINQKRNQIEQKEKKNFERS